MNAEQRVRKTIKEQALIQPGDKLLLGLSGGPDSLCLLHILSGLRRELGFELWALHLNHLMRGERAEQDAQWLSAHCDELAVGFRVVRRDVCAEAAAEGICVEEAGRSARHEALASFAAELGGAKVVFGHNRDDQAETVLMRIMRGTGVHGLAAMEYKRRDGVIRPLLDCPRSEIEAYCGKLGLVPLWDSTNASTDYTRNRIRLQLLPQLQKEYNPRLKETLARLASSAREDDDYLSALAERACEELVQSADEETVCIDAGGLKALHPALFNRVVRLAFAGIGLDEDIASVHISALRRVIDAGVGGKLVEFPGAYTASLLRGQLTLRRPLPKNADNSRPLEAP